MPTAYLEWDPVAGADDYAVMIWDDPSSAVHVGNVRSASFEVPRYGTYFFGVQSFTGVVAGGISQQLGPYTISPGWRRQPLRVMFVSLAMLLAVCMPAWADTYILGWNAPSGWAPSAVNICVERKAEAGTYSQITCSVSPSATTYQDTTASGSVRYRIRALLSGGGYSVYSNEACRPTDCSPAAPTGVHGSGQAIPAQILLTASSLYMYTTTFSATENPLNEGGRWISGHAAGANLWGDVRSAGGIAFGADQPTTYGDPTAVLTGDWDSSQDAQATVSILSTPSGLNEVELRLRTTISANSISGYEAYCSVVPGNAYCHIARWNGPLGSWCNIESSATPLALTNGNMLRATVAGTNPVTIVMYRSTDGGNTFAEIARATDTGQDCSPGGPGGPFTGGSPGIGFFTANAQLAQYGFTDFQSANFVLSWNAPTTNTDASPLTDLAEYRLYYATSSTTGCQGANYVSFAAPRPDPQPGDTMLRGVIGVTGHTYYAQVTAVNAAGSESACSNLASGTAH